jgi:hypothetical protein
MGFELPSLPIAIQEMSGKFRTILLTASFLPRDGNYMTLGGEVRGKTTYYPGSGTPTSQILGPEEGPIEFAGIFEDQRTGIPGSAVAMAYHIDQIRRSARHCRLVYGAWIRRVRWVSFQYRIEELSKIHYQIKLEVVDETLAPRKNVKLGLRLIPGIAALVTLATAIKGEVDEISAIVGGDESTTANENIDDAIKGMDVADAALTGLREAGGVTGQAHATKAIGGLGTARSGIGRAQSKVHQMDWNDSTQQGFERISGPAVDVMGVSSQLRALQQEIRGKLADTRRLEGETGSGVIYTVAEGDTMRRLSQRFYGVDERWTEILRDNGRAYPTLLAGEQLIIRNVPEPDRQVVA